MKKPLISPKKSYIFIHIFIYYMDKTIFRVDSVFAVSDQMTENNKQTNKNENCAKWNENNDERC